MVRRLKWIGYFISVLFAVLFGLADSVKAVDLSLNVSYLGQWNVNYNMVAGVGACTYTNTGTAGYVTASGQCSPAVYIMPSGLNGKAWNKDYVMELQLFVYESRDREPSSGYVNNTPNLQVNHNGGSFLASYLGSNIQPMSEGSTLVSLYFKLDNGISGTQYFNSSSSMTLTPYMGMFVSETMAFGAKVPILAVQGEGDTTAIVNAINQARLDNNAWQSQINQNIQELRQAIIDNRSSVQNIDNSVQNIENNFDQQQQDQQQQGTDGQNDANQAGQDVDGATTNLLSAIVGFFGAFTSATATNCQTDWGIEGFRNFDFCGTQIPVALRVVFTIVASIIFVPMIWFLINSILSAFKEFQQ